MLSHGYTDSEVVLHDESVDASGVEVKLALRDMTSKGTTPSKNLAD